MRARERESETERERARESERERAVGRQGDEGYRGFFSRESSSLMMVDLEYYSTESSV